MLEGVLRTPAVSQVYVTSFRRKLDEIAAAEQDPTRRAVIERDNLVLLARPEAVVREHVLPAHQRALQLIRADSGAAGDEAGGARCREHSMACSSGIARASWKAKPSFTELLDTLVVRAKRHGKVLFHETRLTPDKYRAKLSEHLKHGAKSHPALGKSIAFADPPDPKYTGGSPDALIDGFTASDNYQFGWQGWWGKDMVATIDLGSVRDITRVVPVFLQNQQSWIFLPTSAMVEGSVDGERWTLITDKVFRATGNKGPLAIMREEVIFEGSKPCRYLRITARNQGALPFSMPTRRDSCARSVR